MLNNTLQSDFDEYCNKIKNGELSSEQILYDNPVLYRKYKRTFIKLEASVINKKCCMRDFMTE
jgi:hypothetical protein